MAWSIMKNFKQNIHTDRVLTSQQTLTVPFDKFIQLILLMKLPLFIVKVETHEETARG
jgi:hypothetical protein